MAKHVLNANVKRIIRAYESEGTEAAIGAVRRELAPVLRRLRARLSKAELGTLEWMLVELVLNAIHAVRRHARCVASRTPLVSIETLIAEDGRGFDVRVANVGKPTAAEREQLEQRFRHYAKTRRHIEALRRKYTDASERIRIPGALGGGGFGILECIRVAREKNLSFEYFVEEAPAGRTVFRVAGGAAFRGRAASEPAHSAARGDGGGNPRAVR